KANDDGSSVVVKAEKSVKSGSGSSSASKLRPNKKVPIVDQLHNNLAADRQSRREIAEREIEERTARGKAKAESVLEIEKVRQQGETERERIRAQAQLDLIRMVLGATGRLPAGQGSGTGASQTSSQPNFGEFAPPFDFGGASGSGFNNSFDGSTGNGY
ncbi:hypothetical protein FRC08_017523, partial [Ceratobasidium sp. 394]